MRAIFSKIEFDEHDKGLKIVAQALCDVGRNLICFALRFASEKRANPIIENRYPLERINDALQRIIDRKVKGRSVIVMD